MIVSFFIGAAFGLCVAAIALDVGRSRYRGLPLPRGRR